MISGHGVPGRRFALQGRKRLVGSEVVSISEPDSVPTYAGTVTGLKANFALQSCHCGTGPRSTGA